MAGSDYDDIVVGAGSAGAALATRLSEDPNRRVLLLEAGPDFVTTEALPPDIRSGNAMSLQTLDWGYRANVTKDRSILFPRGRLTGGSSAVGATIALRGMPADFDEWAAWGNPRWAWPEVLRCYERLEDDLDFSGEYHGQSGPIPIRRWRPDELSAGQVAFTEACIDAGYDEVKDHNHPEATGVGPIPSNRRDLGGRVTTGNGYLALVRDRANLDIRSDVLVDRVIMDGDRAVGVELSTGPGTGERVSAGRVILSAGAVQSPMILMRSGIGPAAELRRLGIDVRIDLAGVGANLVDHPRSGVFMTPAAGSWSADEPFLQTILRTTADGSDEVNDLQYYIVSHFDLKPFPQLRVLAQANVINGIMLVYQRPKSRGRLRLTSSDPTAAPDIELNFLDSERDVQVMLDGLRTCWQLAGYPDVRKQGDNFVVLGDGGLDDEQLREYLRLSLDSGYHPVGTAAMGPDAAAGAVVDDLCRVHGASNLFVADASIMPNIVRCNTNLTSIMIGERAAELLTEAA